MRPPSASTSALMASTAGTSLSQAAIATPAWASDRVARRPMKPLAPPTTTATLPARFACASSRPMASDLRRNGEEGFGQGVGREGLQAVELATADQLGPVRLGDHRAADAHQVE